MITVYSSVARDGIVRMALHPMDAAPDVHTWRANPNFPRIRWPFRVAFWVSDNKSDWGVSLRGKWLYSCRGADVYLTSEHYNIESAGCSKSLVKSICGRVIGDGSCGAAARWLLDGEK